MQYLRNRHLTAAATGRQHSIHPQTRVRNQFRQNAQLFVHTDRTLVKFSPYLIERQGGIGAVVTCNSDIQTKSLGFDFVSDECQFNLSHADGCKRVYRRWGERFANAWVIERDCFGGGSVLVLGGIMGGNKTRLTVINRNIDAQTYINDVLALEALPFIQFHGANVTFMQDNARPHSSVITRQCFATNNVNVTLIT